MSTPVSANGRRTPGQLGGFEDAAADAVRLAPLLWDPIAAATLSRSRPVPGERVLDACCGTGPSALGAAVAVGGGGAVDAVDLSAASIVQLQRAARDAGHLPQLEAHVADATVWPGRGYDLVQCVLGVFFFSDPAAGTEHLVRCARPGGRVAVTTWTTDALRSAGQALVRAVEQVRGGAPVGVPAPSAVARSLGHESALRLWARARGLSGITVTRHELSVPAEDDALWLLVRGSGFRGLLAGLTTAQVEQVRGRYLASLAEGPAVDATFLVAVGEPDGGPPRQGALEVTGSTKRPAVGWRSSPSC